MPTSRWRTIGDELGQLVRAFGLAEAGLARLLGEASAAKLGHVAGGRDAGGPSLRHSLLRSEGAMRPTIERVAAGDRFADYCLWDYAPSAPPLGKLRSSTLLWTFLDMIGADGRVRDCCEGFRTTLGPFQTVWGIKQRGGRFSFEFYFYDYRRLERQVSIERVLAGLRPHLASSLTISPRRPYFMFSLDLDDEIVASRRLERLSLYIGNPGSQVSSGICYNVSAEGLRLDNLYYFFDRRKELDDIRAKVACSAHLDLRGVDLDEILWPALMDVRDRRRRQQEAERRRLLFPASTSRA